MTERTTAPPNWRGIYKLAGVAALILIAYSLATMGVLIGMGGPHHPSIGYREIAEQRREGIWSPAPPAIVSQRRRGR